MSGHAISAIRNGRVFSAGILRCNTDVGIADGVIMAVGDAVDAEIVIDAEGCYVLPGLIDLHTHGIGLISAMEGSLEEYAQAEARRGATTFFPTFFGPPDETARHMKRHLQETNGLTSTPTVGGFRLESPYLAKTGAGIGRDLIRIEDSITDMLLDAGDGHIRIWDISPELDGATGFIRDQSGEGIVCSIAHTGCTIEQAREAANAGARLVTHLFDVFDLPIPTDPGVYPPSLTDYLLLDDRLYCEIIGDGTHVHPLLVALTLRCKTTNRTVFVTDSNYGAGMPSGDYTLPGGWGRARIDGSNNGVRLIDRDLGLAGSALTPIDNFRNVMRLFRQDTGTAVSLCSTTPAAILGLNKGDIAVGRDADIIIVDEDFDVCYTIASGDVVYRRD